MEESGVVQVADGRQGRPSVLLVGGFDKAFTDYLESRGDRLLQSIAPDPLLQTPGAWGEEVVFSSLRMAGELSGMDVLDAYAAAHPEIPVIISTHERSTTVVVEAMRRGAFDYVNEPFADVEAVGRTIDRAREALLAYRRRSEMEQAVAGHTLEGTIVTRSRAMADVIRSLPAVAAGSAPVLITGESGVGKGLVARIVHRLSPRASGPFVRLNCAAVPENLLESELFGHRKGAFTGAENERAGLIRSAAGGSLFLDEITLMPLHLQARLLHAIEEHLVRPVGSDSEEKVSFRLIAAGNENAASLVEQGEFRRDLYYRINTLTIDIPPLRERREDIVLLAHHFLSVLSRETQKEIRGLSGRALALFVAHGWPGNVRELRNMVERAVVVDRDGLLDEDDLPENMRAPTGAVRQHADTGYPLNMLEHLAEEEKRLITKALEHENGNISAAAKGLGLPRTTLINHMRRLGLDA
ncbi:MAG: sigma-54-dependent Fis family transcriptional regulator [Planctomycetes bacterium]|nr:sigma-54-dependent Fis family transcriptional regulator [Planctomycetota bacterium]